MLNQVFKVFSGTC